jgi:hypothetical protein
LIFDVDGFDMYLLSMSQPAQQAVLRQVG